jgi:hypothetical protein
MKTDVASPADVRDARSVIPHAAQTGFQNLTALKINHSKIS